MEEKKISGPAFLTAMVLFVAVVLWVMLSFANQYDQDKKQIDMQPAGSLNITYFDRC